MWDKNWNPKLSIGDIWHECRYSRDRGYRKVIGFTSREGFPCYDYVKCNKSGKEFKTRSNVICEHVDKDLNHGK